MQNLNDFNRKGIIYRNQEGEVKYMPSKFERFSGIVWLIVLISVFAYVGYMITSDYIKTQRQIDANLKTIQNSREMQEYRAKEARRQREKEKQKRLKQLGINGISEPTQKNDLLNEQLRKQEIAEDQASQKTKQVMDYRQKLEIYRQAQAEKDQRK